MVHEMKAAPVPYHFPVNGSKPVNPRSPPAYIIRRETGNRETVKRSVFWAFHDFGRWFILGYADD